MSDDQQPIWDKNIWNAGQMAEKCMAMGAVILKPKSKPPVGFSDRPDTGPPKQQPGHKE